MYFCVVEPIFTDAYFMKLALAEAARAFEKGEVPVGALVVANDRIIARGHNLTEQLTDVTAHAEMQAITAAAHHLGGKYLHDCTLYVTLEPCLMCAGALYWSQISKVVYGASDPKRGGISVFPKKRDDPSKIPSCQPLHPKTQLIGGVMATEATQLLQDFFAKKR
jgi:tRNA(adenine34) deaminase